MNISFGKNILLSQHRIYDKQQQKFVNANLYEIDGNDESDIDYIARQAGSWGALRTYMTMDMATKHSTLSSGGELTDFDKYTLPNNKFYSLENDEGKSIGLLETTGYANFRDVHYFQADPDKKYKYVGQVMLAEAAKDIADKEDAELTVNDPSNQGREFYMKCGFKQRDENPHRLYMQQEDMLDFIENVQENTKGANVDFVA